MVKYMRHRTKSRQIALQNLYQIDLRGKEITKQIESSIKTSMEDPSIKDYAIDLIRGCLQYWEEIDDKIENAVKNWSIARMAAIDRTILRIAMFELLYEKIPSKVVINEAIELGKKFSTENSGAFINGVLDNFLKKQ